MCSDTWPSYTGSARKACELIVRSIKRFEDTAYGKTKIFIRSPQTLTLLEQARAAKLPQVVLTIQRVSVHVPGGL